MHKMARKEYCTIKQSLKIIWHLSLKAKQYKKSEEAVILNSNEYMVRFIFVKLVS